MVNIHYCFVAGILLVALCYVSAISTTEDPTPPEELKCRLRNSSCEDCTKDVKCYWCGSSDSCHYYGGSSIKTYFKYCSWGQARWKQCWLNVQALVIVCAVISVIGLMVLFACCCWCSRKCRARRLRRMEREEENINQREMERKERSDQKAAERKARNDEMRQKYGIPTNGEPSYERLQDS